MKTILFGILRGWLCLLGIILFLLIMCWPMALMIYLDCSPWWTVVAQMLYFFGMGGIIANMDDKFKKEKQNQKDKENV